MAISFWIISTAMVTVTMFLLKESMSAGLHRKTPMNVDALVTLIYYFHTREFWVQIGAFLIVYRYIDWPTTVPLQVIEFHLILPEVSLNTGIVMFWRLLVNIVVMLTFGFAEEDKIYK